jgi:tRNA pseudouridine38-40 synthase
MQRYFTELSYKGTHYHGWQIQPNAVSVQEALEKAFSLILRSPIKITGAGRTDTGVHAEFYTAHFEYGEAIGNIQQLIFRLNRILPKDIAIYQIYPVPNDMHARFSAVSRTYRYQIARKKLPFVSDYSYYVYGRLDLAAMQKASDIILKYKDFTSFSKSHTDTQNNLCEIYAAGFKELNGLLLYEISANRFLRNMVRAVVGTLIEIGQAKISPEQIGTIIEEKNRSAAGKSVPGKGLFLTDIQYPER